MSKAPEPAAPSAGGAYVRNPETGELRRDGRTEQTKDGDLALPPETPKAIVAALTEPAKAPADKEPSK